VSKEAVKSFAGQAPTFLALLAAATLVFTPQRTLGLTLTAIALAAVAWKALTTTFASTTGAQLMLVFGVIASAVSTDIDSRTNIVMATAGATLLLLIVVQPTIDGLLKKPALGVGNLPGYRQARAINPHALFGTTLAAVGLLTLLVAAHRSTWPVAIVAVANLAVCVVAVAQAVASRRPRGHNLRAFRAALERYRPAFALYFSAPPNTDYHVHMWLPYLERIGRPFVLIVREPASLRNLAATGVPIVYCPSVSSLDQAVTPGMRACFYVNNGAKNTHMVRFNEMTHIQLLHGDSDKASSFNPVTAMFDRVFVAGQAGIDRYAANGVHVPLTKFDIVGRPQVETVEVAHDHIRDVADRVVLYATTWIGFYTDANYCSLPIGEPIVRQLLERGATVILRPHPYAGKDADSGRHLARLQEILAEDRERTGRQHVFGPAAQAAMSVVDCVNAADAMISDVSGVASDFLYSGKPFALTNMLAASAEDFERSFPLAKAAYVINDHAGNLPGVLDDLLDLDPLAAVRREVRTYYLGDFAEDAYADGFVQTGRSYVDQDAVTLITPQSTGVPA
jgi:hypothetical protein